MASLAKVTLIGNLGRDPETRYTPNGTMNVQFSMATTRRWRDASGQDQERTTWFRITAWGKLAETLDSFTQQGILGKGKQVYIEGRIEAREYTDQSGQTRTSLDVTANEFQLLGTRADAESGQVAGRTGGGRSGEEGPDSGESQDWNDVPF